MILHTKFGLIWSTPGPNQKDLFLQSLIWNNCKFRPEKTNFFPRQAMAKLFCVLDFRYKGDTPYRVRFDLGNCSIRWKTPIFKFRYSRNLQIFVRKTHFFPRQSITKIFLSQSPPNLMIHHTKFGLIWRTSGANQKDIFLQSLIWNIGNFSYEKLTFFPRQAIAIFFCLRF